MLQQQSSRSYVKPVDNRKSDPSVWKQRLADEGAPPRQEDTITNLLMKTRLLPQEEICHAMEIAESLGQPVDQVLSNTGILPEELRNLLVRAASFIERGLVSEALAIDGLHIAHRKRLSFEGGLSYFGWGW